MKNDKKQTQTEKPTFEVTREADGTIKIKITVPSSQVEKVRSIVQDELIKNVELAGFRKGKAPPHIAAEKLDKEKIREEILKKILPDAYAQAVKELQISPIVYPKIHVEAFEEGTDLVFVAQTCEQPKVELKNYKEEVKKITAKSKIFIPGKDPSTHSINSGFTPKVHFRASLQREHPEGQAGSGQQKPDIEQVIDAVLKGVEITIPKLLAEQELNRLLSQLLDELKTLGVTLEQYLSSRGKTGEQLRNEYSQKAERALQLEFVLRKVADVENIRVEQEDIDKVVGSMKDDKQKQTLAKNPYLLASIIRQQKTLDFLTKI